MTFWCFVLGLPLTALGLFWACAPTKGATSLVTFPRMVWPGRILTVLAWFWTAHACDTIGIDVFDKFLKIFPAELWILAVILSILTCWWMPNLLPIRALSGIFMLFPGELFPAVRLCETPWRLTLVVFAYFCAFLGMFGMFYPWRIRQFLAWCAQSMRRVRIMGVASASLGLLFLVLGVLF